MKKTAICNKEIVMKYLKTHLNTSKKELYNMFLEINHSVLGLYYNEFKWFLELQRVLKEKLISELAEESERFITFKKIVNDYAKKNNIKLIWRGLYPILNDEILPSTKIHESIGCEPSFSNKDPLNPYFYKEIYGISIFKNERRNVSIMVSAFSYDIFTRDSQMLCAHTEECEAIPINPLKSSSWHIERINKAIRRLYPNNKSF